MKQLGLIGTGTQGQRYRDTIAQFVPGAEVVAVSNTRGKHWVDVINTPGLDGVIVAADPAVNHKIVKACNFIELPVLLEKPAGLYDTDVQKYAKCKIPILVNYIHLFSEEYQKMKAALKEKPARIVAFGYNDGPFRNFSPLYDYAPHYLAMCQDLCQDGYFQLLSQRVSRGQNNGYIYNLHLNLNGTDINLKCGNGAVEKKSICACWTDLDKYIYNAENETNYRQPMINLINHFLEVIDGATPIIPLSMTLRIHTLLYSLGAKYDR